MIAPGPAGPATSNPAQPAATRPVVEVTDLTVTAGARALVEDVTFSIRSGERVGLIGASGSGKTITASTIAGLLPGGLVARGSVVLGGDQVDFLRMSERQVARYRGREVGMVFQEPLTALNPTMRVGRQVAEALTVHGATRAEARTAVESLLGEVGLDDPRAFAARFPHELSGGQRQRVVLAMALANRPHLLICDEPTTALDVSTQAQVIELIDRRCTATGAALLFISHNLAVVTALCDYVLVMWQGRIVEQGSVLDVTAHPQHPHTQQLIEHAGRAGVGDVREGA